MVADKLEQVYRKFLWGEKEDRKRVHLVGWSEVTKSKVCQWSGDGTSSNQKPSIGM